MQTASASIERSRAEDRVNALRALLDHRQTPRSPALEALAEGLADPVYTTDAAGYLTYYNPAAQRLWGWQPPAGRQQWCGSWRLFRPSGAPLPHDECPTALALREVRPVRGIAAVAERPDGIRVPFMPFPTPLVDGGGQLSGALNLLVADSSEATLGSLYAELQALEDAACDHLPDLLFDGLMAQTESMTRRIADAPVFDLDGMHLKLTVLRDRIAGSTDPEFAADALTLRLAEALLRDLGQLRK
jgi:hypothetical protein